VGILANCCQLASKGIIYFTVNKTFHLYNQSQCNFASIIEIDTTAYTSASLSEQHTN